MENYININRMYLSLLFVVSLVLLTATFSQSAYAAVVVLPGGPSIYVPSTPYYGYGYRNGYSNGRNGYYHRGGTYNGYRGGAYHHSTTYRNGNVYHHGGYYRR